MSLTNYVKFLRGTSSQYNALTKKDKDTLYFISEPESNYGALYLGSKLIAGGNGQPEAISLDNLKDVTITEAGITANSVLVYDEDLSNWVNKPLEEVLNFVVSEMQGGSESADGKSGLVPTPKAGEQDYFLRGDGSWAKVASETKTFEVIPQTGESHTDAITRVTESVEVCSGDIAIVKELIANDKHQYTAYVYDNSWKAMDGNYNAENVYFDEDLITTSAIGVIKLQNGQATIPATGKNLKEVFNTIFVKEENPKTTNPSASVNLKQAGSYEVGETVKVDYSVTFNGGSYTYGPQPTGVAAKSFSVTDGASTQGAQAGSFADLQVTDSTNYRLSATVAHTGGNVPVTNTGNEYAAGAIKEGSVTGYSNYISGFRPFFYGMSDTSKDSLVYDSAFVRSLKNGGAYNGKKTLTFKAADLAGVKRFVVAIPSASINGSRTGIESAVITSSMNADALDFYTELESTVAVQGKNGYATTVPYRIWVYEPTSIAAEEVHEVVLK